MKKLFISLLVCTMILGLSACGDSEDPTSAASSIQNPAQSEMIFDPAASSAEETIGDKEDNTEEILPSSSVQAVESTDVKAPVEPVPLPEPTPEPAPEPQPEPEPVPDLQPEPQPEPTTEPQPTPEPEPEEPAPVIVPAAPVDPPKEEVPAVVPQTASVIGNKNTKKYHVPSCSSVTDIKEANKITLESAEAAQAAGYVPCKRCH